MQNINHCRPHTPMDNGYTNVKCLSNNFPNEMWNQKEKFNIGKEKRLGYEKLAECDTLAQKGPDLHKARGIFFW